jgi:hypothetical protein
MTIAQTLLKWLRASDQAPANYAPDGYCPNCWGRSEYAGNFYDAVKNNSVDVNSTSPNVGWIQEYAATHLSGIKLAPSNNDLVCPSCKVQYKKV